MPIEPLRIRLRAWLQERLPLAPLGELLYHKTVPLHKHYLWYYLGGILLLALGIQLCTGFLLIIYYQPAVSNNANLPGAHESVSQIVNDLPHGWWIRSIHHWGAHLMIMAAFIHMFSVLLLKAYRRPREFIWWTGLALFVLILTAGFTGYLLPWNNLSFAATRVGGGIAGAIPLAGPLIHYLLMAGPDISGATLTRFFGLHVTLLPLLIIVLVVIHICLMAYHGSSTPPSVQKQNKTESKGTPALRFWPEFILHDFRVWLLILACLLIVAFFFPPLLGERADPLAPASEDIRPEWYFLSMFKTFKLLPDHVLGFENLQMGVMGFGFIGLILVSIPMLYEATDPITVRRRWIAIKRRILLLSSFSIGWPATIPLIRYLIIDHQVASGMIAAHAAITIVIPAIPWLLFIIIVDRISIRYPNMPSTVFGLTLISACMGYTFWEAFGAHIALAGLGLFWVALLVIWFTGNTQREWSSKCAILISAILLIMVLLSTIPLGIGQEFHIFGVARMMSEVDEVPVPAVPPERLHETTSRFIIILTILAFLLVVTHRRLNYQRKLHDMGLMK